MTHKLNTVEAHRAITKYFMDNEGNVRRLIGNDHNLTSGEYKEYLIRGALKQNISKSFQVVRGIVTYQYPQRQILQDEINFIEERGGFLCPEVKTSSGQIDIMIISRKIKPLLEAGDLRIVTPDSVRAVAEIKTRFSFHSDNPNYESIFDRFASRIQGIRFHAEMLGKRHCWAGIFIFRPLSKQHRDDHTRILSALQQATRNNPLRVINCVSIGEDVFIHFWGNGLRDVNGLMDEPVWHSYQLKGLAPSYFVSNMLFHLRPPKGIDELEYFPLSEGKETHRRFFVPLQEDIVHRFPDDTM